MSDEKKYVVPREMMNAAIAGYARCVGMGSFDRFGIEWAVEAALRWLAENPIVPSHEQIYDMEKEHVNPNIRWMLIEWQRQMFLAPDPDSPIKDLIFDSPSGIPVVLSDHSVSVSDDVNSRIREAYRRGQKDGNK